jgi:predicted RNA-binding protein (TIGR00451 family)
MLEGENECRVQNKKMVVSDEAVPFVARGGRIFSNQVIDADPEIQAGDNVLVVDKKERVLTTARAVMTPEEMSKVRRNLIVPMAG